MRRFEGEFLDWFKRNRSDAFATISAGGKLSDDTAEGLKEAITAFKREFLAARETAQGQE